MNDLVLEGCVSSVLASYLKALAVHRLVAEQLDPGVRSWWDDDGRFHLESSASREELVAFFAERYAPTPVVTPWNGGSGWWGRCAEGLTALRASDIERLAPYRATIDAVDRLLAELNVHEAPEKQQKWTLLGRARSRLPDEALSWLDAVYAISEEPVYAALLGSGGNDGNMDFASNFMQRLAEVLLAPVKGNRRLVTNADRLDAAIFGGSRAGVVRNVSVGQFVPARVGGANLTAGFSGGGGANPWDYILAIEGTLLFAGAAVRRLESAGDRDAAFPFHVAMSAVGYGSASVADREKDGSELWLPLWSQPASFPEAAGFFSEGRLQVGSRRAHDGLDAARALALLGVDRGIERFQRVGILMRNGRSFLATSQGTLPVRAIPRVALLDEITQFVRRVDRLKNPAPAVSAALRALRSAMFAASRRDLELTEVLCALGALERAITRSPKAMGDTWLRPLRALDGEWFKAADDGSAEFALAASFSTWRLRADLEPHNGHGWDPNVKVRWSHGAPLDNLVDVARRRLVRDGAEALRALAGRGHPRAPAALGALIGGAIDLRKLDDLLFGLALVTPPDFERAERFAGLDGTFHVLRAVTSPTLVEHRSAKDVVAMLSALDAGHADRAVGIAVRRVVASGWRSVAPMRLVATLDTPAKRAAYAAALLVPLPRSFEEPHLRRYLRQPDETRADERAHERND